MQMDVIASQPDTAAQRARRFIVWMGIVALFGDMTYEGARGLVGPYLAMLGASAALVGFAAGFGEFLGYALRLASGWLSDRTRAYWPLVIAGYAMNFLAVPGLALVGHWQLAVCLMFLERIGKAVRSPARSTLVSYAANEAGAGWSFGLEELLDQIGAVSGPLLTAAAMWVVRDQPVDARYRVAFAVLMLPVLANLTCVLRARAQFPTPETLEASGAREHPPLGSLFRWYVAAAMLVALGFSDWALIAFHAARAGVFDAASLPVVYAGAMAVDAVAAFGFGVLFDRYGLSVLALSTLVSALSPLAFVASSSWTLLLCAAAWAVGMGAQESIFKAAIAKLVPKHERGRAYGLFFALFGLAWWVGSTSMGYLYEHARMAVVVVAIVVQLMAAGLFLVIGRRLPRAT